MEPTLRLLPLAAVAVLGACAPSVRLPTPEVGLPAAFEPRPAISPSPATPAALTLDRWWDDFGDPQLSGLVTTALERSTTIRMAYARIAEARAVRRQSTAATLPSGSLTGSATEQGSGPVWGPGVTIPGNDSYLANFAPSWEVDLFGRLAEIRDRAALDNDAATLDFYAVRLALAADVATSLFRARFLATQLTDARDNLRIAQELADNSAIGATRGLTAAQDVARLRADAASREAEVTRLTGELQVAKRSLLILIGTPAATTDSLPVADTLDPPPSLPVATPGELLMRRPDVRSAELKLQSAASTVTIDRLGLFPRFTLTPGVGLTATGGPTGVGLWSIVAGATLPILDRARLLATLRVSEARGQQAVVTYEKAVQTAFGEAENSLTSVAADARRSEQLNRAERESRIALDAARRGYRAGLTDLTTLLQSERTWRQNRTTLNGARVGLLTNSVAAIRALGGGWNPARITDPAIQAAPQPAPSQPATAGNP
ncbi:efflux transporter outer membrane subunit [Sphingobium sufflavum]|uniref:efflux transporter outer membrane subunit n=1 Tax=Sphingobium sufflavum TaxID=1129547 RepID=UPI001F31AC4F|nr:efflux transporter outer membrane subunit [Sphingobium sufflavum]MCE7796222.1 efflux transporter outer membrane subunit [Sphingobium sufflavum]